MRYCDLTQFYSPVGGGVKRYVSEKVRYIRAHSEGDEHVLIVPGEKDAVVEEERARVYTIQSPLISRTSRYRVLLRLERIEEILMRERPALVECGDPYQVAWKAVHSGAALRIPVIGFYHSHFPEAYIRTAQKFCGPLVTEIFVDFSRRYIRSLYNRFERTVVPASTLGAVLGGWGVRNVEITDLGVDTSIFQPLPAGAENVRAELRIPQDRTLLLYVGRLAQEKNTRTLFEALRRLHERWPRRFHLLIVGDGLQRPELLALQRSTAAVTWLDYCADASRLATLYRAADLFVHPGVQETFGLVSLEAQACGTPVIGIRGSHMDRIIHGDQTLWARENSAAALSTAIEQSSREDLGPGGRAASEWVRGQYGWDRVFSRLFDLYRRVIHNYVPRQ